jgi:outer membrane protein insertion porin family
LLETIGGILRKIISGLFIILMFVAYVKAAEPIVKQIEVRGLKRIDEYSVRNKISQQIAVPLDSKKVNDDIKNIFNMGYFSDVRVDMEFFEGGIKLIYVLKEKPVLSRVSFHGNDEFDDEKLKEQITLTRGSIADENLIHDNALKLKAFYESEGYWLSEVVPVVRKIRDTNATVTYMITENEKVKIDTVEIVGNEAFSDEDIKDEMETSEWWLFSFLTGGGYYNTRAIKQDLENIKDLYFNNGYLNIRVSEPEVQVVKRRDLLKDDIYEDHSVLKEDFPIDEFIDEDSLDENVIVVKIVVSEGRQYSVASVSLDGNKTFPTEDLMDLVKLEEGEIFSKKIVTGDVMALTDYYSNRGFALVSIDPKVVPVKNTDTVTVNYRILEGDIFHIGRIEISGNTKTKDNVIRREIRLDEGDKYDGSKLKRSYQRLTNLDYFETVELQPRPKPKEKLLDLDVHVKDKSTGMFTVGGGYSSLEQFIAMVDLTQNNLFGSGKTLKLSGEFGGLTTTYSISYIDPWFLDKPLSFSLKLFQLERNYFDYKKESIGFGISLGKRFAEFWSAGLAYNLESVAISNIDASASDTIKDQEGESVTSSISPSIVRDSRDYFLDPHSGSRNALYLKYAGLGGDNQYFKGVFDSSWFFPLGPTTFAARGRYGYADGLYGEELPLYERFYVGGINTIRGLDWGQGGPKDENGDEIGGEEQLIFNFEYIFPLVTEARLKGLLFYDVGRAWNHDEGLEDMRNTVGTGVRWISPVGPLRIECGYLLDKRSDESESKCEFTFGTFF